MDLGLLAKSFKVSPQKMRKMIFALCIYFCSNIGHPREVALIRALQTPSENILRFYLDLVQEDMKEILSTMLVLDKIIKENSSPEEILKAIMSSFKCQHQKIFKVCSRLLHQPVFDLEQKSVVYLPCAEFSQIKKRIREDNTELLTAFSLGLINPKYLELFCPGINASYFIDYESI